MSKLVVEHENGPLVQVVGDVTSIGPARVGLLAQPETGRGWVELTPDEAEAVARELIVAAAKTRKAGDR